MSEFEYNWKRIDYLIEVLKDVHPQVVMDVGGFLKYLEAAEA